MAILQERISIPVTQFMAPFVGVVEIDCGTLILVGLSTRLAAISLLVDTCAALYSTKIVTPAQIGVWSTPHEARPYLSMLFGPVFQLLVGGATNFAFGVLAYASSDDERNIVLLPAPAELADSVDDRIFELLNGEFRQTLQCFNQARLAEFIAGPIHCLRYAVGVEHQCVPGRKHHFRDFSLPRLEHPQHHAGGVQTLHLRSRCADQ